MTQSSLPLIHAHQIDSVLAPIEEAVGMPNAAYVSDAFFSEERDGLMANTWACLGFASDVIKNGYVKPVNFMGLPLLMMRNKDGVTHVFHNVCSHRGMQLVAEEGEVQGVIRCPYHSWTYDLNGNLKGTPHIGGFGEHKVDSFQCEKHGLKPVRSAVWMDMVFINLDGQAPEFADHVAPLEHRWRAFIGDDGFGLLRRANMGGNLEINVNCNWKLAVENYCESYHLPWVHPSLNSYSRLVDHYNIEFGEHFSGQGSLAYRLSDVAGTQLPKFPSWPKDKLEHAEYISFFPNVLLGIQADHFFAMMLEPVSAGQTIEHLRVYYVGDESVQDAYAASRTSTLESWRVVFGEDIGVVEGMQAGRQSPGFNGGVFSPVLDHPTYFFHQWVARQIGGATNAA